MERPAPEEQSHHHDQGRRSSNALDSNHKEVARGTLRGLIRAANITADEFVKAI